MKTFLNTLSNTYKAVRLLSNPTVGAYLEAQLREKKVPSHKGETFGKKDAFFHKHYIVHVVN